MRRAGILAATGFGALLAGCSLLFSLDAADYVALPVEAGAAEAGPNDAAGPPGTRDAAADGHFCASLVPAPTFCEDFDDSDADLGARWPTIHTPSSGTLDVDRTASVSPPSSLRASMKASGDGAEQSFIGKTFAVTTRLHVSFDARADVVDDPNVFGTLMGIMEQDDTLTRKILYGFDTQNAQVDEQVFQPYNDWPKGLPGPPPVGQWVHYDLEMNLLGSSKTTLTIFIDGAKVIDGALGQVWPAGQYEVDIGLWWEDASTADWALHYDNVVIDAR